MSAPEHEPCHEGGDTNQHGEGIMEEIAGLQPDHSLGDIDDARRDAVRTETVDQPAVAARPQEAAEPLGPIDEDEVIKLVEIPLVEQELIERPMLFGELARQIGAADIEEIGKREAAEHRDRQRTCTPTRA